MTGKCSFIAPKKLISGECFLEFKKMIGFPLLRINKISFIVLLKIICPNFIGKSIFERKISQARCRLTMHVNLVMNLIIIHDVILDSRQISG